MEERYIRNIPSISENDQRLLKKKKIAIIGCGGLGGYLCEFAARLGIGFISVCDGDVFEASNLNRQILSAEGNLGTRKAAAAKAYIERTNPDCKVKAVFKPFSKENVSFLKGCDLILDGLDNVASRLDLEDVAAEYAVPIVHAAISGWQGQALLAHPGRNMLHKIYENRPPDSEKDAAFKTALPFTAALAASLAMACAVKYLTGKNTDPEGTLLLFDLFSGDFDKIRLKET